MAYNIGIGDRFTQAKGGKLQLGGKTGGGRARGMTRTFLPNEQATDKMAGILETHFDREVDRPKRLQWKNEMKQMDQITHMNMATLAAALVFIDQMGPGAEAVMTAFLQDKDAVMDKVDAVLRALNQKDDLNKRGKEADKEAVEIKMQRNLLRYIRAVLIHRELI